MRESRRRSAIVSITVAVIFLALVVGAVGLFNSHQARAWSHQDPGITYVTGCMNITEPGYYELSSNITGSRSVEYCIEIFASNVVLNGNGYGLSGNGSSIGVFIGSNASNVTVEKISVARVSFIGILAAPLSSGDAIIDSVIVNNYDGVVLLGSNDTVSDSVISGNSWDGINIFGSNDTVIDNTIVNNALGVVVNGSNDKVKGDSFVRDGLLVGSPTNMVVVNDTVNGKPLVYLHGASGAFVRNAGQVLVIDSNNITLIHLNLSDASVGVEFLNVNTSRIENSTMSNNGWNGIYLIGNDNTVYGSTMSNNGWNGIYLIGNDNTVYGSTMSNNGWNGIYLIGNNSIISDSVISGNSWDGIDIFGSNDTVIDNTIVNNQDDGVYMLGSNDTVAGSAISNSSLNGVYLIGSNDTVIDNTIVNNQDDGVYIFGSNDTVIDNTIVNNNIGVQPYSNDLVTGNIIANNQEGVYLQISSGDLIYNNLFDNTNNAEIYDSLAYWNITLRPGRNIVGGYMVGGNAWLSPNGTGFSQVTPSLPNDPYICDEPYVIGGNNTDYLPLKYNFTSIRTYAVTFVEKGLPPGTTWSVALSGTTESSNASRITFQVLAGKYYFSVGSVPGYSVAPSSGTISVSSNTTIPITFTAITTTTPVTTSTKSAATTTTTTTSSATTSTTTSTITTSTSPIAPVTSTTVTSSAVEASTTSTSAPVSTTISPASPTASTSSTQARSSTLSSVLIIAAALLAVAAVAAGVVVALRRG